jgi:orotidine-5'-phosphate decarboxylase
MSSRAALYRERAALFARIAEIDTQLAELAGDVANDGAAIPTPKSSAPKRRHRSRPIVVPPIGVSEVDVQRAVDAARRRGIMVGR